MTGTTPRGATGEQEASQWVRGMFGRIAGDRISFIEDQLTPDIIA